jgi:hypothetical protein
VVWVEQPPAATFDAESWSLIEIWTRNHIYEITAALECIAVIKRSTGQVDPHHALRGTRLFGGERRVKEEHRIDMFFPLPAPGAAALFRNDTKGQGQFARTSTVERVVVRVRVQRIAAGKRGT